MALQLTMIYPFKKVNNFMRKVISFEVDLDNRQKLVKILRTKFETLKTSSEDLVSVSIYSPKKIDLFSLTRLFTEWFEILVAGFSPSSIFVTYVKSENSFVEIEFSNFDDIGKLIL